MGTQVIVVGGGLSGLTTAYQLQQAGVNVIVLESHTEVGGCIKTSNQHGYMLEHGPNSMLVNRQQILDFITALGLADQLEEANAQASKRFIAKGGAMHALPSSLLSFLRTPLFSLRDKLRLFAEPFIGKGPDDETIAQFVRRRLGNGFYDYAINPFVSGVYAGDPEQLLARAAIRKVWVLEEKHGSLIGGALAMVLGRDKPEGRIKGRLLSFKNGMASLPKAIGAKLGDALHLGVRVEHIEQTGSGWTVQAGAASWSAKHLVLATPARATARLLAPFSPEAVANLEAIPYAPVAVVHLGLKRSQVSHLLDGFGCLIPRKEGITTLGTLFSSTLFGGRAEEVLITCFIGGATLPEIREWDDDRVLAQVLRDLGPLLGFQAEPPFSHMVRWDQAIPQYTRGHYERLAAVKQSLEQLGDISVRANWLDGISLPDCILNSINHATEIKEKLGVW